MLNMLYTQFHPKFWKEAVKEVWIEWNMSTLISGLGIKTNMIRLIFVNYFTWNSISSNLCYSVWLLELYVHVRVRWKKKGLNIKPFHDFNKIAFVFFFISILISSIIYKVGVLKGFVKKCFIYQNWKFLWGSADFVSSM